MGGGLMQLVAYGAQDIYLTGNPQITFFKVVYRRHTNFAMETVEQTFSGTPDTNKTVVATVSRNGDLVGKMYVTSSSGAMVNGSTLVSSAEVEIGGQKIDKQTAEWMQIWNELSTPDSKAVGLKAMQCDIGTRGSSGVTMAQVPLQFWFNRNPGLALPLIALQYHEVKVKVVLGAEAASAGAKLYADYIYLDTDERRRFAQVSHEYLIEQVQVESAKAGKSHTLNFNHPVKELIWTNTAGADYGTAKLVLNGHDRFAAQAPEYFQLRQPYDHHTAVPKQNLPIAAQVSTLDRQTTLESFPTTVTGAIGNVNAAPSAAASAGSETAHMEANVLTIACAADNADAVTTKTHKAGLQLAIVPILAGTAADFTLVGGGDADVGTIFFATLTSDVKPTTAGVLTLPISTPTSANGTPVQLSTIAEASGTSTVQVFAVTNGNSAQARTSQMTSKINCYSFALKPEEHQPSGTCNFSRIDNAQLVTTCGTDMEGDDNIYAVNYNVLRVMSGMGGLAYSN